MRYRIKQWSILLLAVFVMIQIFTPCVYARESVDTTAVTSLRVRFRPDGNVSSEGVTFRLYRIADIDNIGQFKLLEKYVAYDLAIDPKIDQQGWKTLADTISSYITADGIEPDSISVTNYEGTALFKDLSAGLYLVTGEEFSADRKIYTPETFIVSLPDLDEDEKWVYDVSADVKYESRPDRELIDLKIIKVWDDREGNNRPDSITAELYDGEVLLDTVILDKTNDWSHLWENLYSGATYSVIEKDVPEGYKVSVEKDGNTFIITNHRSDEPVKPELPYTGVLWWPVALLMFAGLILMFLGYMEYRRKYVEK